MKSPTLLKYLPAVLALSLLTSTAATAQNAQWNALFDRIIRLEANVKSLSNKGGGGFSQTQSTEQLRQLLNEVRQMRQQILTMDARLRRLEKNSGRSGAVVPRTPIQPAPRQQTQFPASNPTFAESDLNQYEFNNNPKIFVEIDKPGRPSGNSQGVPITPFPKVAKTTPGSWQNPAPGTLSANPQPYPQTASLPPQAPQGNDTIVPGAVERQPLDGAQTDSRTLAKKLYDRSRAALRSRRYGAAEAGFKSFLRKYGKNSLAPSAQFMLGETYYIQKNYRLAAQTYLKGYQKFPKSKRSSDTLLKLGMAMGKLGQKPQSCGVYESVISKYKSSSRAVVRAKKEMKRARC